jgi:hypothetical protein
MKTRTSLVTNWISRSFRHCGTSAGLLFALALASLALSPTAHAVVPAPDGGYANFNTAEGTDSLLDLTTGVQNTAAGFDALLNNTTGDYNTAVGAQALISNTIGEANTANGEAALFSSTTGNFNTATGRTALLSNTTGNSNTAYGDGALFGNTTGSGNIAVGPFSGSNLVTGSNNIYIGNLGSSSSESAKIRIGTTGTQRATFIAGISGVTVPNGVGVIVGTNGQLGTLVSSERFKDAVKPMDKASEAILALKPVTFRYKHELDPEGIPQFGLVAEEVEKVNPDLVARDEQGKPYTVRYEAVNAMLLNEFLKEHRKLEEQERKAQQQDSTVADLRSQVQALTAALREQASQLEKVNAELAMGRIRSSGPAPQILVNNP